MQGVPKLMEHGGDLIPGKQSGHTFRGLGHVQVVGHNGLGAQQVGLCNISVHPRTAALGFACVVVLDEQRQRGAIGIEYFPYLHVRVIYR